jgi:hypothetical protein
VLLLISAQLIDFTFLIFHHFNNHLDTFCVNTVINFYCNSYVPHKAIVFYFSSLKIGFCANSYTFVLLISACSKMGCVDNGRMCHGQAVKNGVDKFSFILENENRKRYTDKFSIRRQQDQHPSPHKAYSSHIFLSNPSLQISHIVNFFNSHNKSN